jgi:formate-dependent nitrite reductase membrane component NrfD
MNNHNGKTPEQQLGQTATVVMPEQGGAGAGRAERWTGPATTYYGLPLIKKAHWEWQIVLYFFLGGMAGGSFLVSTLADLFAPRRFRDMIRAGRYLSFVCILASPVLLIMDLGRPERFYNMLRVFKLRSVMSLGSWGISVFGMLCGFTTAHQMAEDGLLNWFPLAARIMKALPVKVLEAFGSVAGLFVASYTGVLLSSTAVPVWARARHILGPLFITSGLSTALSAISLILSLGRSKHETLEKLDRAEIVAMTTELGLIGSLLPILGPLGKPLFRGKNGTLFTAGTIGTGLLVPLLIKLGFRLSGRTASHEQNIGVSLLVLVGGYILRHVWIIAGRASADNPEAVHYYNAKEWNEGHK